MPESVATYIRDVEVMLSLEPEEFAPILLKLAKQGLNNMGMFMPEQASNIHSAMGTAKYQASPYSRREDEVDLAIGEGWNWLRVHGMILPAGGSNGRNGWMVISRRGGAMLDEGNFTRYREAAAFPKSLLHPSIAEKVWLALSRGDLSDAVFIAFRAVEEAVRAGKYSNTDMACRSCERHLNPTRTRSDRSLILLKRPENERRLRTCSQVQSGPTRIPTLIGP
jgi:hypothetical protein